MAARRVSKLRAWATKYLVVADGPKTGRRWRPGGPAWIEVLDACDDRRLEQVTIRGSVQSGKTLTLIAAALGHFAAGRSVLFYEPDHKLRSAMAARVRGLGAMACRDPVVRDAYTPPRPPWARTSSTGGRLEVLSAGETGAALMRTALGGHRRRAAGVSARDMLGEIIDRMASLRWQAVGSSPRRALATRTNAGQATELGKSDARHWFHVAARRAAPLTIPRWESVKLPRTHRQGPTYLMPCCGAVLGVVALRRAVAAGRWKATQEESVPGTRGYHLDCFTSPFESLLTITRTWKRAS